MNETLEGKIKDYALDLGYCKVGITSAGGFEPYRNEVLSRGESYGFLSKSANNSSRISEFNPEAKSIIVLAWDYMQNHYPEKLSCKIGRVFLSRSYNPPPDRIHGARLQLMKDFLSAKGITIIPAIFVPLRYAAAKAGVVSIGKNSFAYVDGVGSFVSLFAIVVDAKLQYDAPVEKSKCPPNCTICRDACPTKSISEPFKMIPGKCIAFNTYITARNQGVVSPEIREKLGNHVYGCDVCQEVCPRNASRMKSKLPKDAYLEKRSEKITLTNLLHASANFFGEEVLPLVYNFITERKYIQRNAAIAIGNTRDESYLSDLEIALNDSEEIVRAHVAWALGQIAGLTASNLLLKRKSIETSDVVLSEINQALSLLSN